jgi:hypothetical protein
MKSNNLILHTSTHKRSINTNMLSKLMLHRACAILIAPVLSDKKVVGVVTGTPKSFNNHRNQVTYAVKRAIACNSASALERETTVCFFDFQAMREPPRKT